MATLHAHLIARPCARASNLEWHSVPHCFFLRRGLQHISDTVGFHNLAFELKVATLYAHMLVRAQGQP
eukprot:3129858-Pyramimonas_sp.AAC.1